MCTRKQIKIPTPHYIVFYNGLEKKEEEFVQRLSDAFEGGQAGCIELTVRTININYGQNNRLLKKSKTLSDYAYFIAEIRNNLKCMKLEEAVVKAVEHCIKNDILKEFLLEQKSEVIAMSIYEYNEEYVRKTLLQEGQEIGYAEGKAEMLIKSIEKLMENLDIDIQKACVVLGITTEEYEQAKETITHKDSEMN